MEQNANALDKQWIIRMYPHEPPDEMIVRYPVNYEKETYIKSTS